MSLPRTAVVGAGPSGLALARAFLADGLPIEVFERHSDVGGIWDGDNEGTPMYESAHMISSKTMSAFPDFPMPESFPDYPGHREILSYLRDFADHYGLRSVITTNCGVRSATWDGSQWELVLETGEKRTFEHLVCANGTQWDPAWPEIDGEFTGELVHSQSHWSSEEFRDKRVLIIGAGNSGVDIACDAAQTATKAVISMRRGYHVIPKHLFGQPTDVFADTGPELPPAITQFVFAKLIRLLYGNPVRYGLPKPDHKVLETHPILNSEILHYLSHGDLSVGSDVSRFEGSTVHFTDGTSDTFDIVVCATGYNTTVPYLDSSMFEWRHNRPQMYLHAFHRTNPNLHALGFTEGDSGGYTIFDNTAVAMAGLVRMLHEHPERRDEWLDLVANDDVDLRGGVKHIDTPRHANYLHSKGFLSHLKKLTKRFEWAEPDVARYEDLHARLVSSTR